jgi:hypothetical protein
MVLVRECVFDQVPKEDFPFSFLTTEVSDDDAPSRPCTKFEFDAIFVN